SDELGTPHPSSCQARDVGGCGLVCRARKRSCRQFHQGPRCYATSSTSESTAVPSCRGRTSSRRSSRLSVRDHLQRDGKRGDCRWLRAWTARSSPMENPHVSTQSCLPTWFPT